MFFFQESTFIRLYETGKLGQLAGASNQDILASNQDMLEFMTLHYFFSGENI